MIRAAGYDPDGDLDNPTGSVFCSHGAGFAVPWDQVEQYMHLESPLKKKEEEGKTEADRKMGGVGTAVLVGPGRMIKSWKPFSSGPLGQFTEEIQIRKRLPTGIYSRQNEHFCPEKGRGSRISSGRWLQYHFCLGRTERAFKDHHRGSPP